MADVVDGFVLEQGADWALNDSRRQPVPFVVLHRTIGHCPSDVTVGRTRHHNTPGTFQLLTCGDGGGHEFYPPDVRCSHAAGGNKGCGIENAGGNEERLTPAQVAKLGQAIHWLHDVKGVPLAFYDGPRIWADESGFRGFINHASIAYPPNRSYEHYDYITRDEWNRAVGSAAAPTISEEELMRAYIDSQKKEVVAFSVIGSDLVAHVVGFAQFKKATPAGKRFKIASGCKPDSTASVVVLDEGYIRCVYADAAAGGQVFAYQDIASGTWHPAVI